MKNIGIEDEEGERIETGEEKKEREKGEDKKKEGRGGGGRGEGGGGKISNRWEEKEGRK